MVKNEKKMARTRGFTLIELLIVVAILGGVMVAITQLLATVLSGSGKSAAAQGVKENGQFAIATIEKTVRRAKDAVCLAPPPATSLVVVVPEQSGDVTYTFSRNGNDPTLTETMTPPGGATSLIDPDVTLTAFSCVVTPGTTTAPAVVTISMTLRKTGVSVDQTANIQTFSSSISLRTY